MNEEDTHGNNRGDELALQKWLMRAGVGSKGEVREWIAGGLVRIAGKEVTRFAEPVPAGAVVTLRGVPVAGVTETVVFLMNKPKKHLTQLEGEGEQPGLGQYLPDDAPRVFPVGRLDYNSEGALLFTNDGELARRVLHPDHELPKRYAVKLRDRLADDHPGFERMRQGITLKGVTYMPAVVEVGELRTRARWVRITITEGKNREIRNMCDACNFQVVKLRREAIGPIELGDLNPRVVRRLTDVEVEQLRVAVGLESGESKCR